MPFCKDKMSIAIQKKKGAQKFKKKNKNSGRLLPCNSGVSALSVSKL